MAKSKEDFTDVIAARDGFDKAFAEYAVFAKANDFVLRNAQHPDQAKKVKRHNVLFRKVRSSGRALEAALKNHGLDYIVNH
jgi:hypothetical protein